MRWKSDDATSISPGTTTLTTSYTSGWVTSWADVGMASNAALFLGVTKGTSVTIELKLEFEDASGTTGYEGWKVSSGAASLNEIAITSADLGATHNLSIDLDVSDVRRFRVRAKHTTGTGASLTCAFSAGGPT